MDNEDKLTIVCSVVAVATGAISIALAYKEYKTNTSDHERIEHLEDTVKWMIQNDLNLQKESDQSKN